MQKTSKTFRIYLLTALLSTLTISSYATNHADSYYTFSYEQLPFPDIFTSTLEKANSLNGMLRSQTDLAISETKNILCSQQNTNSGSGVIDVQSLILKGNRGEIKFLNNSSVDNGGAICTSGNCDIINNFANQYFVRNRANTKENPTTTTPAANIKNRGGAIHCEGNLSINNNQGIICFAYNSAKNKGGAISTTQNLNIAGNSATILLMNNFSFYGRTAPNAEGGAVFCNNLNLSENTAPIYLVSNTSPRGGACCVETTFTISNNSDVIFFANNSGICEISSGNSASGGAISCTTLQIENNSGPVCFNSNVAINKAGAIFCTNLTINNSGPIQFTNNHSTYGGAVLLETNGVLDLSADYGDIIFDNNYATHNGAWYRNAWHCIQGVTTKLGAKKHRSIKTYDPIEAFHPNCPVTINPEDYHKGTVLFSSLSVSEAFTAEKNFFSYIKNPLTIKNGVLAVEDRAGIAAYQITQEQGSILRLGNKAVIATSVNHNTTSGGSTTSGTSSGSQIIINQLALNLPSIIQKGAEAPKIWIYPTATTAGGKTTYAEDNNPDITISGPLLLLDSDNNDPHDSLNLSAGITKVPFLYLCDNENKKITITDLNIEAINNHAHYGYQGIWSPHWEEYTTAGGRTLDTANKSHRILYADWTPTHYIPNPKFKTPLIANALWQTFYTTMAGMHSLPSITLGSTGSAFEFRGEGLGIAVRQRTKNQIQGFRMESSGYAAGTSSTTKNDSKLALSFSQHFSQLKEKLSRNKLSSKNYFAGLQIYLPWLENSVITTGSMAYNYGDHKVKNFYKEDDKASEGSFYSHSFAATVNCTFPFLSIGNEFTLAPFVEAIAFRSTISSFEENGDFVRRFSTLRPLRTLTTPVGIAMQWDQNSNIPTIWKLKLAYQPIVHKQYPQILTTLKASNGMWASYGTPITRHSFLTDLNNETQIFNNLKIFLSYHGEISSSTFSNYLKVGSSMLF
ncbi:polymorphic outer membrane protein middle domain-containing protein [Chlamydia vaughanii]|uniref:polymorphic outer membrane protein middle domain-containing protein n=1 Tax=Chlamydia vaughanii TaxID=3112552 RepID=UPI0032B2545C